MKKEYIKPSTLVVELDCSVSLLAGSNPASLQNVEFSSDEASSDYDVL